MDEALVVLVQEGKAMSSLERREIENLLCVPSLRKKGINP